MPRARRETVEAMKVRLFRAFERGWADSLRGYYAVSMQPVEDIYAYGRGWHQCADYRWADPNGRGVAPDPSYRPPFDLIMGELGP